MSPPSLKYYYIRISMAMVDAIAFFCAAAIAALILTCAMNDGVYSEPVRGRQLVDRACDEIYVVGEGETLNTISDKCGDPYIVERNPHIHDPDDVFPGLVIKIVPQMSVQFGRPLL